MSDQIRPEKLVRQGKKAYEKGDFIAAAEVYSSAADRYEEKGDFLAAAEMRNNCCVAYLQAGEGEVALSAVHETPAVFAASGDLQRQGMALGNLGAALEAVDRLEEAAEVYSQSVALLQETGATDLYLHVVKSLSALYLRTGRHVEALAIMQSGLDNIDHPNLRQRALKELLQAPFKLLK